MSDTTPREQLADLIEWAETDTYATSQEDGMPRADILATAIISRGWRPPAEEHREYRVLYPSGNARYYPEEQKRWARMVFEAARDDGRYAGVRFETRTFTTTPWEPEEGE